MRKAALLLLAPTTLLACFSSSSGGVGPDANFNPQQDAEFNDSGSGMPDSSVPVDSSVDSSTMDVTTVVEAGIDAGVDAPVEAGPQPVTLAITNVFGPASGVTVLFSDSTGMPLGAPQTTGSAGTIVEPMLPSGSQMTIIMGTAAQPYFFTVQGVVQGDSIAVYDPTADQAFNGNNNVSIDSWPDAAPPGTTTYQVAVGSRCFTGGNAPPILESVYYGCEAAGQFPILLTGENANFLPTGYTWQKGNVLPADGGVVHVDLTNAWSTTSDTETVTAAGPPAYEVGDNANLAFTTTTTGVPTSALQNGSVLAADAGMTWPFTYPDGYPETFQAEADLYRFLGQGATVTSVATRVANAPDAGTIAIDLSQALPTFQSSAIDTDAGVTQPVVNWSLIDAGSIAAANGIIASILWHQTGVNGTWVIVAPPTATQIQPPAVSTSVSASAPSSSATWTPIPVVAIVQATFFQGYAGLRARAGVAGLTALISASYGGGQVVLPPLTADGTLQMSAISTNGD